MSSFGSLLKALLADTKTNQPEFAAKVASTRGFVNNVIHGHRTPPLEQITKWADALGLKGAKREQFIELAELAHAPERVARRYLAMQERLRALEERIGKLERG